MSLPICQSANLPNCYRNHRSLIEISSFDQSLNCGHHDTTWNSRIRCTAGPTSADELKVQSRFDWSLLGASIQDGLEANALCGELVFGLSPLTPRPLFKVIASYVQSMVRPALPDRLQSVYLYFVHAQVVLMVQSYTALPLSRLINRKELITIKDYCPT